MSKTEVVEHKATEGLSIAAGETMAVLQMIKDAAGDPKIDVTKMRELMEMRKEIVAEAAKQDFNDHLTQAQQAMRPIEADANNPQTKSRYATYQQLDKALRPIYIKHGFSLSFNTGDCPIESYVRVECIVARGLHERKYQIDMPADGKGAKGGDVMTKTHATGSAVTYGMRYLLKMIFNIVVGDDDGNAASGVDFISEQDVQELENKIADSGANKEKFLAHMGAESLENIRMYALKTAHALLNAKAKKEKAAK